MGFAKPDAKQQVVTFVSLQEADDWLARPGAFLNE